MPDPTPTPAAEGDAAAPAPKGKMPLIAAIVVGLAVGAGSGAAVVGPIIVKKMGISAPAITKAAADSGAEGEHGKEEGSTAEGAAGEHGGKGGEAPAPPVLVLENLVLNPASSGGTRYLLLSMAIEAADAKTVTELTARDAELKDLILTTLGSKTVEQLSDVSGREAIKTELTAAIVARFGKKSVKQLYFPQFVIQ
ncbi:MAG: flagellar basal body-associated FliL family protein [Gemmatimonadaceae bacterium]